MTRRSLSFVDSGLLTLPVCGSAYFEPTHSKDFDMTDPNAAPAAPAPAAPAAPATPTEKWNVLSIVAFVLAIVQINVVAIILGFIGLSQVKKTGERGRGLAIAAIIIGFASIAFWIIFTIVLTSAVLSNPELTTTY
jgi:hypothetical protein